jgi:1-acyl-sn-glycerol-3-phosphate acyltransferase
MTSPKQNDRTLFYRFARTVLKAFSFLFYPCSLQGIENANLKAPFIIISNHQSMMDPVLLAVKLDRHVIHFIGKRELTSFKPLKWIVEHLHMIAVSRHMSDLSAMRAAGAVLKNGQVLGIFPEGSRNQGPSMEHLETGVTVLLQRHRVPLLPVYIADRPRPFRRVKMVVLPPLRYDDLLGEGINMEEGERLGQRIKALYQEMDIKYNKNTISA